MKSSRKYLSALACVLVAWSCSVTRHLPPESYMLTANKIETDRNAPREERISAGDLDRYVRQTPTKKLLGINFPAWLYNQADPRKDNGWNNLLRRLGSEPVLLDTAMASLSNQNIRLYMRRRGFYDSSSDYDIRYRNRKATVVYTVRQGEPFRVRSFRYEFQDPSLEEAVLADSAQTLIRPGMIFDLDVLDSERKRIVADLKNKGYYAFSVNNLTYEADTLVGNHQVDLTMVVHRQLEGYDAAGEPVYANNAIYRIGTICVFPNYNATRAATDPDYLQGMDTLDFRGLKIVGHGKPKVRPQTFRRAVPLYRGALYRTSNVQRTAANLQRMDYFTSTSLVYSPVAPTAAADSLAALSLEPTDTVRVVPERQLDCNIYCTPAMLQGYTIDFEGTMSSAFYALRPTISYLNRNVFRGAELLNISLTGGYEFNQDASAALKNAYEIGLSASVTFPRFLGLSRFDRRSRMFRPTTRMEVSTNLQRKSKYDRNITGASIGYTWGNGRHSTYTVRPIDFNLVDVRYIDEAFLNSIQNSYLRESYKSQYIAAISGSYVYNLPSTRRGHSLTFRVNAETAGNITDGLAHWFSSPVTETVTNESGEAIRTETYYKVFNIRYSQYFRVDASFSSTIPLGPRAAIAYRVYGGIGLPYGNSSTMPMDRMFYVGGSNSMRGWPVRTLGPGTSTMGRESGFKDQLGNMRLEANLEFRFPIWQALRGAVFFDAGNVWMAGIPGAADEEVFRFDRFYRQLGFNTGLGLRYDLDLVVIRLDWGLRLHDPSRPAGDRWIKTFRWSDTAFNFGIGYPF